MLLGLVLALDLPPDVGPDRDVGGRRVRLPQELEGFPVGQPHRLGGVAVPPLGRPERPERIKQGLGLGRRRRHLVESVGHCLSLRCVLVG